MQEQQQQFILLFWLIIYQIAQIQMQEMHMTSPCPEIFRYRFDGMEWFGMLTIRDPSPGQPLYLNVALSIRGKPMTSYLGEIELITRGQFFSDAPVLYKVKFPKSLYPPKLQQIKVNKQVVCYGTIEQAIFVTQIQLEHTRKFTFMPDDTSLPLTTGLTLPSVSTTEDHHTAMNDATAAGFHNIDELLTKKLSFDRKHLPLTKFNPLKLSAKDICGTIDNRIRFQGSKIVASKSRRTAVENNDNNDYVDVDYHNDAEEAIDKKDSGASIPLVTTADFSQPLSNDGTMKSALEHLPSITRGAWPWLAAVYINNLTSLFYQCGGTLISTHVVISSAHCFVTSQKNYSANELLVFLGRHNLNNWNEEGSIAAPVDDIFIHPQFNSHLNTYDADIAVLVLKNSVRFNTFIRPACLWSGATNSKYIHGENGIIVGWGSTRAQSLFNNVVPRVIEAPIVSNDVCFNADEKYYSLSSNRTFCAGIVLDEQHTSAIKANKMKMKININGKHKLEQSKFQTGPCAGDSGAGLMILKNKRWILRGIVSASLPMNVVASADVNDATNNKPFSQSNSTRFACNINQYVIYTDVAKFLDWIYAFII